MRRGIAPLAELHISAISLVGLFLVLSPPAWADVIYTYTGNDLTDVQAPYTTADKVTATITLASPLGPGLSLADVTPNLVALTMSDGVQTLDLANPGPGVPSIGAFFSTDAAGNITEWSVCVCTSNQVNPTTNVGVGISTSSRSNGNSDDGGSILGPPPNYVFGGDVFNNPGVWTLVPEPDTMALLAMGLVAMAGLTRRRV
jgi:hypothetical protein